MERLARVIGPAPSEMTLEELEEAIKREHSRVSQGLISGARPVKKRAKPRVDSKTAKAKSLEEKYGMSLKEMQEKLELLRALEAKGGL